jgi:hypothetical protein
VRVRVSRDVIGGNWHFGSVPLWFHDDVVLKRAIEGDSTHVSLPLADAGLFMWGFGMMWVCMAATGSIYHTNKLYHVKRRLLGMTDIPVRCGDGPNCGPRSTGASSATCFRWDQLLSCAAIRYENGQGHFVHYCAVS